MQKKEREYAWIDTAHTRHAMTLEYPDWVEPYLSYLRERMDKELSIARNEIIRAKKSKTVHYWRRIIAFFHQEIELFSQGEDVYAAAFDSGAMVVLGRG
jgi:predicted DNA-binding protein (UPF0278 family)